MKCALFYFKKVDFRVQPESFLKNPKLSLGNMLILQMGLKQLNLNKKGLKWPHSCHIFLNGAEKVLNFSISFTYSKCHYNLAWAIFFFFFNLLLSSASVSYKLLSYKKKSVSFVKDLFYNFCRKTYSGFQPRRCQSWLLFLMRLSLYIISMFEWLDL